MYKKIRDGLNQRDPEIEDWTKRLMIDTGLSLFDVFSERTITGNTWRPNIKGAGVLYEALYDAIWRKLEGRN
jgi:hypothetical protein